MKLNRVINKVVLIAMNLFLLSIFTFAQESAPTPSETPAKQRERLTKNPAQIGETTETKSEDSIVSPVTTETPAKSDDTTKRTEETSEEEAAILPYLNNYLREYRLGPEDVISVEVFGQPNYSKAGIIIPPTAKISYQLIPGGVFVGGKTTDQVAAEIAKKLDEYIIDPQVTVTLDKVGSAQFAVLGKVGAPGVRIMSKRYSIYDAVIESGGFAPNADKKKVLLLRRSPQGGFSQIIVNFEQLMSGKVEIPYLVPGDQVIVPEKKWSMDKILGIIGKASAFRVLFGAPF